MDLTRYRRTDPNDRFRAAYDTAETLAQDGAKYRAGNALRDGNNRGAAGELYGAGMLREGAAIEDRAASQAAAQAKADQVRNEERAKFTAEVAQRLRTLHDQTQGDPQLKKQRVMAGFRQIAPRFRELGETDDDIAELARQIDADPETTLTMLGAGAAKEAGYEIVKGSDGSYVAVDPRTGRPAFTYRAPNTTKLGPGEQLIEVPGSSEGEAPASTTAGGDWLDAVAQAAPDAGVTSGKRTPERNAAVGGKPDSRHLDNGAVDLVPRPGETMQQLYARVRGVPGVKVINEGDHVHVQTTAPRQKTPGVRVLAERPAAPKERTRPATAEEKAAYGIPEGTAAQIKPDGSMDVVGGVGAASNNPRKAEADLRKEFNQRPEVKEYRDVSNSYRTIRDLFAKPPSAAGDIAGIFSYMKMLDPGSVVREGEFATAQNAAGVPDQVKNLYNKVLNGQRLNPTQRADFLAQAESIYSTRSSRFGDMVEEYRGYATDYGLDPERIASRPKAEPKAQGGDFTPAQRAAAQKLAQSPDFKRLSVGTKGRPYAPRTEAEFDKIPRGHWYIDTDGQVFRRGGE